METKRQLLKRIFIDGRCRCRCHRRRCRRRCHRRHRCSVSLGIDMNLRCFSIASTWQNFLKTARRARKHYTIIYYPFLRRARESLDADRASGKFDTVELNNPRSAHDSVKFYRWELSTKLCERERSELSREQSSGNSTDEGGGGKRDPRIFRHRN